jgi:succinate dehydrogenase / fumarate reductase cytochrome b subunit
MTKDSKFNKFNRPLSPHLSIYKPQISSVLSIMHRLTGLGLYLGLLLLSWYIIASIYISIAAEEIVIYPILDNYFGRFLLVCWSFALFYHLLNGIRHLFWDMGKGFELKTVTITGICVIIGAVSLTIISFILI